MKTYRNISDYLVILWVTGAKRGLWDAKVKINPYLEIYLTKLEIKSSAIKMRPNITISIPYKTEAEHESEFMPTNDTRS